MNDIRILQNQDKFTTKEYAQYVTPLITVLNQKGFPRFIRELPRNGIMTGLLMYIFSHNYNVIVTVGHKAAMGFGLLNRLFPKKGTIQIAKEFYFEKDSVFSVKKYFLGHIYRYAYKSLTAIIVNSKGEIEPYAEELKLPVSKFYFIPWPSSIDDPEIIKDHDNYILAVGRSLRDWKTFFSAIEGMNQQFVVVASRDGIKDLTIPANTQLHTDISYDKYLELLRNSNFVVLPLVETQRSSGQATYLEAMAYGKPVIVAEVVGTFDYLTNGVDGLLYTPGDVKDLKNTIIRLCNDIALQSRLAINGHKTVTTKFNKINYASAMTNFIKKCLMENRNQTQNC